MSRPFYVDHLLVLAAVGATSVGLGALGASEAVSVAVLGAEGLAILLLDVVGVLTLDPGGRWGFRSVVLPGSSAESDGAGADAYDSVDELPRAEATEHGLCGGCGSRVPPDREYCPDCTVDGRWRK